MLRRSIARSILIIALTTAPSCEGRDLSRRTGKLVAAANIRRRENAEGMFPLLADAYVFMLCVAAGGAGVLESRYGSARVGGVASHETSISVQFTRLTKANG